jgi:hypothetical protein
LSSQRFWSQLAEEVIAGERRELRLFAAEGLLPLPPNELLALQIVLAQTDDAEVATLARQTIEAERTAALGDFISEDATSEEISWLARNLDRAEMLGPVVRRRDVPTALLVELASKLDEERQEALLLRQDRIVEAPEILDALERNPRLSGYAKRRILEYREHLLGRDEDLVEASDEEVEAAIAEARGLPEEGERDAVTGLAENQVRGMGPSVKLKLARTAKGAMRFILIRDASSRVALTALQCGGFSDAEIELIARNRSVLDDVLDGIAANRAWARRYPVVLALCGNPKTRVNTSLRLLTQLAVRDLRGLAKDRNVSDTVRSRAQRLYTMKSG